MPGRSEPTSQQIDGGPVSSVITTSQWLTMRPFVLIGAIAIIGGGLVAAVTGPLGFASGSWAAAYLVLVVGAAQVALGGGQAMLADTVPSCRRRGWQLLCYNTANVAVLTGTLTGAVAVVVAGGVMLFVALVLFLTAAPRRHTRRWPLMIYRGLIVVLAVSIPVGLVLSALRHG
ncbi:MAG TPA: hypothetical protein VK095_03390 [Beutenbergiaceae bacterium]|nr:hypothetical protein [Beutenbergiaceae bacterium]